MPTLHLLIKGKVQGVFYRASAKEAADKAGIKGWVKNTLDGNVEIMISGTDKQLQNFVDWCKKGPPRSAVSEVIITEQIETPFIDFTAVL